MGEDLDDLLAEGNALAQSLVEHLISMGAAASVIPVTVDGAEYAVAVQARVSEYFEGAYI